MSCFDLTKGLFDDMSLWCTVVDGLNKTNKTICIDRPGGQAVQHKEEPGARRLDISTYSSWHACSDNS